MVRINYLQPIVSYTFRSALTKSRTDRTKNLASANFKILRSSSIYSSGILKRTRRRSLSFQINFLNKIIPIALESYPHPGSKKRNYSLIDENKSISRASDYHIHDNLLVDLDLAKGLIQDHAYTRVQILYYLLLLYYRENCDIQITSTIHQHGKSKCQSCSAAHSSILPNVHDDKGVLSRDTHFYQNMNSTVEVPKIVNDFDCIIENRMRNFAITILNNVSKNNIHPFFALKAFVKEVEVFFQLSENEIHKKLDLISTIKEVEEVINKLELCVQKDPVDWMSDYVKTVRHLYTLRKKMINTKTCSGSTKIENYLSKRSDLFSIINMNFQDNMNYIKSIENIKELKSFANRTELIFPFYPVLKNLSKPALKKHLLGFYKEFGHLETFITNKEKANQVFLIAIKNLEKMQPMEPDGYDIHEDRLYCHLKIIKHQKKGTVAPSFKYLSGKMTDGVLKPMNESELLEQKKELQLV